MRSANRNPAVRVRPAAARTVEISSAHSMKWIIAGLALAAAALAAGLASIVLGYRQVIGRYIEDTPATEGRKATDKQGNKKDTILAG